MKQFEEPEICIVQFDVEDIMTTSSDGDDIVKPGIGGLPVIK